MKKVCALIIAIITTMCAQALANEATAGLEFEHTSAGVILTGYSGAALDVEVPASIEGSDVTIVASNAFAGSSITSVILPETVTLVQAGAFDGCAALESVTILSDTCAISPDAFSGCGEDMVVYACENSTTILLAEVYGIKYEVISDYSIGIIGGSDGPTSVFVQDGNGTSNIGKGLKVPSATAGAGRETAAIGGGLSIPLEEQDSDDCAPLCSFHDFTGIMPYEYVSATGESGSYRITYRLSDFVLLEQYLDIFRANGWMVQDAGSEDGASYTFAASPDSGCIFYVTRMDDYGMVIFVFEVGSDYGFDPTNGL